VCKRCESKLFPAQDVKVYVGNRGIDPPRKYIKPTYTKNDLRLRGQMMWRMKYRRWASLTGEKQRRIKMDGEEQLERGITFLDRVAIEEEEEDGV
jgi:hypothetical protein